MYTAIARHNNVENVQYIIKNEAYNIDMPIKNQMTALMVAASEGRTEVLQIILDAKPDMSIVDAQGRTALMFACGEGKQKNIQLLIKYVKGIWESTASQKYLNARTNGGNTALMFAVDSGEIHAIAACINAGCNPFLENGLRERPLDKAKQFPNPKQGIKISDFIGKAEAAWKKRMPNYTDYITKAGEYYVDEGNPF